MTVNLQAEAVIRAKDETGAVIDRVSSKFKRLGQAVRNVGSMPVRALDQAARTADRIDHVVARTARAVAGGYAMAKAAQLGGNVVETYKTFDDLVRYQRAVMGISAEQQKPLIDQAIKLGASTPFNDLQVLEAQLALAQRGIKEEFIKPIIESAAQYAQAMNVELPQAAQTVEGLLFSTGQVVTDGNTALAATARAVDQMAKAAKISGMSDEDLRESIKFSGLSGSTAGLSNATILAALGLQKRANIPGSEAGVAVRAMAGRLVAPTKQGLDALAAMGIDYNKYTATGGLSSRNLENFMTQRFGHHLRGADRATVAAILADPEIVGDRGKFVSAMFTALRPGFGHGRGGKMRPQDARELTRAISDFYKYSVQSVRSEDLLRAIMDAHPTIGQLNALFGQKQGARIMAIMRDAERFEEYYEQIKNAPAGFAKSIADERMGGAAGAMKRASGSWLNVETALGRSWDAEITGTANAIARLEQSFVELDQSDQRLLSEVIGVTTAFAGLGAMAKGFELGLAGTAAALSKFAGAVGLFIGLLEAANWTREHGGPEFWKKFDELTGADALRGWYPGARSYDAAPDVLPHYTATGGLPEVKGSADLNVNVQVEPSDSFISRIISTIRNEINVFSGGTGTAGSTGRSMPEAVPVP